MRITEMETPSSMAAAIILAASSSLFPAPAQTVTRQAQQVANDLIPAATTAGPHYEWQYHYVGRHGRIEGHWVLAR
jgi:hypothetical protein